MIFERRVKPRATRMALIVASVPELTSRTCSIDGTSFTSRLAISSSASVGAPNDSPRSATCCTALITSGCAWPAISGPHEPT